MTQGSNRNMLLKADAGSKQHQSKTKETQSRIAEAIDLLASFGVPLGETVRQQEQQAMVFLAVACLEPSTEWFDCKSAKDGIRLKTRDIIAFQNSHYEENISFGSYDDVRRKHLKAAVEAGVIIRPKGNISATNDPTRGYALSDEHADLVRQVENESYCELVAEFMSSRENLSESLARQRDFNAVPVTMPSGVTYKLSAGGHNELQRSIIQEFLPRYGYDAEVWYLGDSTDKSLILEETKFTAAGLPIPDHNELPDVIAFSREKNWVYFIEAVHSSGEVSEFRRRALMRLAQECKFGVIFITAFQSRKLFRKFVPSIAWETEVWIAEEPDHVIHFDGERFLGPYPG